MRLWPLAIRLILFITNVAGASVPYGTAQSQCSNSALARENIALLSKVNKPRAELLANSSTQFMLATRGSSVQPDSISISSFYGPSCAPNVTNIAVVFDIALPNSTNKAFIIFENPGLTEVTGSELLSHPPSFSTTNPNHTWAGYALYFGASEGTTSVTEAAGQFNVTKIHAPSSTACNPYCTWTPWIGLSPYEGGNGTNCSGGCIAQTGVESTVECSTSCAYSYEAWYEFLPSPSQPCPNSNLVVSPGDLMYAQVSYSGGTYSISLSDQNTGQSCSSTPITNSTLNGGVPYYAEFIGERSSGYYLPMFGFTAFGSQIGTNGPLEACHSSTCYDASYFSSNGWYYLDKCCSSATGYSNVIVGSISSTLEGFNDTYSSSSGT